MPMKRARLHLRLAGIELVSLKQAADRGEMSLSEFVRRAALAEADRIRATHQGGFDAEGPST